MWSQNQSCTRHVLWTQSRGDQGFTVGTGLNNNRLPVRSLFSLYCTKLSHSSSFWQHLVIFNIRTMVPPVWERSSCQDHQLTWLLCYANDTQLCLSFPPQQVSARISDCLSDISAWTNVHHLQLNLLKTELLVLPAKPNIHRIICIKVRCHDWWSCCLCHQVLSLCIIQYKKD